MKLAEIFKRLGINLEQEIEDTKDNTLEEKEDKNNFIGVDEKTTSIEEPVVVKDETLENKEEVHMTVPKYDPKTGLFDLSGIEDGELKAVLKQANDTVKNNANQVLINSAVNEKVSALKLSKGITGDAIKALLDMSGIKVTDGKVTGLDEAVDKLKTAQSGLFVADTTKASNPMLEGFNPQQRSNVGDYVPNSFSEAFNLEEM